MRFPPILVPIFVIPAVTVLAVACLLVDAYHHRALSQAPVVMSCPPPPACPPREECPACEACRGPCDCPAMADALNLYHHGSCDKSTGLEAFTACARQRDEALRALAATRADGGRP